MSSLEAAVGEAPSISVTLPADDTTSLFETIPRFSSGDSSPSKRSGSDAAELGDWTTVLLKDAGVASAAFDRLSLSKLSISVLFPVTVYCKPLSSQVYCEVEAVCT